MSILSEILATKRTEVDIRRRALPLSALQERLADAPPARDFHGALAAAQGIGLIAEVKKASPSKGVIRHDFDPVAIAREYEAAGATCLSVLTDEPYFQGRLDYLREIRATVQLPVLRKDFIIDPWQIGESRAAGADAILLIVAALTEADLCALQAQARAYSMAALVEVHDAGELEVAVRAGADLIGINNRDLHTFRTDLSVTLGLLRALRPDPRRIVVSESGIFTNADAALLHNAGVGAILVGEALMREADITAKVHELLGAGL